MKALILFLIFPINLMAGGVDVGNGSALKVNFHSNTFLTEIQLKNSLKSMVWDIKNHKYTDLRNNLKDADCDFITVDKIERKKKYKILNNTLDPLPRHKGIIEIKVYNCKKPQLLILDYDPNSHHL